MTTNPVLGFFRSPWHTSRRTVVDEPTSPLKSVTVLTDGCNNDAPVKHHPPVLSSMLRKGRSKVHRGGEGVSILVNRREHSTTWYWASTLFVLKGRAMPWMPQLVYLAYTALVVFITMKVNGEEYKKNTKLKALQFPIQTIGTALFLLLTFRTNSCYDRWWEGRKLWGAISAKCQDISRLTEAYLLHTAPATAHNVLKWTITLACANKWNLRRKKSLKDVAAILSEEDLHNLAQATRPVDYALSQLSKAIAPCFETGKPYSLVPVLAAKIDNNVAGLVADCSACVRIITTPMPFAYVVHLRSFMVLWLFVLPFALVVNFGWHTLYVTAVIGFQLFGFEDIGIEIENPFGDDFNDLPAEVILEDMLMPILETFQKVPECLQAEAEAAARGVVGEGEAATAGSVIGRGRQGGDMAVGE